MDCNVGRSNTRRLSALVVDDDATVRIIHVAHLKKHGFETYAVENGKLAVDLFRSGERFDVIFMDFNMPVMNGIEATRELRDLGVNAMIVGISDDRDHTMEEFIQAGMDQFYEKPIKAETVISILRALQGN
ncbi:Response regulatory domain-containing protein [Heracleum sosnowskyi]|uniref:Response regulatory domain-containing protein n=1 Tax=Heracleum sosnowskyi TaxID=360622 RepID=A0AAD8GXV3_9APIA|nr:Response regulatory domain-containing protein [Heracleum sosnowskyi]